MPRDSFNTSHVTLYQSHQQKNINFQISFNTSHVTLYRFRIGNQRLCVYVSIHLMLLFIGKSLERPVFHTVVSIHLMLLFIGNDSLINALDGKFQYISCYSLSETSVRQSSMRLSFNTSHVTLYLFLEVNMEIKGMFQYISCYSLSGMQMQLSLVTRIVSIHLMLLFIWFNRISIYWLMCFNTSHVTLYLFEISSFDLSSTFQYISCYSLSHGMRILCSITQRFNTSHVTLHPGR